MCKYRLHLVVNLRFFFDIKKRFNMVQSWKEKYENTLQKNLCRKCSKSKMTMKEYYCSSERVFCFALRFLWFVKYMICEKYKNTSWKSDYIELYNDLWHFHQNFIMKFIGYIACRAVFQVKLNGYDEYYWNTWYFIRWKQQKNSLPDNFNNIHQLRC